MKTRNTIYFVLIADFINNLYFIDELIISNKVSLLPNSIRFERI